MAVQNKNGTISSSFENVQEFEYGAIYKYTDLIEIFNKKPNQKHDRFFILLSQEYEVERVGQKYKINRKLSIEETQKELDKEKRNRKKGKR